MKVHLYFKNSEDLKQNYMKDMNSLGIDNSMISSVSTFFVNGAGNPKSPIVIRIDKVEGAELLTTLIKKY